MPEAFGRQRTNGPWYQQSEILSIPVRSWCLLMFNKT